MKIAILDDEKTHLQLMEQALVGGNVHEVWGESVTCHLFGQGETLLEMLKGGEQFDCLLLDRHLPDMSGDVILAWLRQHATIYMPVVMVTSLRLEESIVQSLNAGADDYVCKPFRPIELLARVQRLIRQTRSLEASTLAKNEAINSAKQLMSVAGYDFDSIALTVTFEGQTVVMTEREFWLSQIFFSNLNGLMSRSELYEAAWRGKNAGTSRALDTHIYRVRNKLNLIPERGFVLRAVYGYGYRLEHFAVKAA